MCTPPPREAAPAPAPPTSCFATGARRSIGAGFVVLRPAADGVDDWAPPGATSHVIDDDGFAQAYGLSAGGATLVRPDGVIAWRRREAGDRDAIAAALATALALSPDRARADTASGSPAGATVKPSGARADSHGRGRAAAASFPRPLEPSMSSHAPAPVAVRSFVTVAYVDELVATPELLRAYASVFGAGDDATLVLYAPGDDTAEAEVAAALEPLLAAAGCDPVGGPDLLALVVPEEEGDAALRDSARALLSRRAELHALPRFDETSIARLRSAAEAAWLPSVPAWRLTDQERFDRDLALYRAMPGAEEIRDEDLFPQLGDWRTVHELDPHYFHQDSWAANRIAEARPARHVDIGSRVDLVGFLTAVTNVTFVDIRPLEVDIERLTCVAGSILDLPFEDRSLESVSSLHVVEHIGLGRYGDPLDAEGSWKAMDELQRVVAPGGHLLFSGPIGRHRVCFNAHRIHDPLDILARFAELELVEFSVVDDANRFRRHEDPAAYRNLRYGCGMFLLRRPADG